MRRNNNNGNQQSEGSSTSNDSGTSWFASMGDGLKVLSLVNIKIVENVVKNKKKDEDKSKMKVKIHLIVNNK